MTDTIAARAEAAPRPEPGPPTGARRRRPKLAVALVVIVVVGAAVAGVATVGRGQTTTATTKTTIALQAIPVTKADLATYTSASGTLGYGAIVTISEGGVQSTSSSSGSTGAATGNAPSASSGAAASSSSAASSNASSSASAATTSSSTVTRLAAEGATLHRGDEIYAVDNQPRVLFFGPTPAWRELSAASTPGVDVFELEQNLVALGYDPDRAITIDETFDDATTLAVTRWQKDHGYDQTGAIPFGQVVFLDGPVRVGTHHAETGTVARAGTAVTELTVLQTTMTVFAPQDGALGAPIAANAQVKPGSVLFTVGGQPVIALSGTTPIARRLAVGVADGDDIRVLKQNLVDLGADPQHAITVNGAYDAVTADAVNRFMTAHGGAADGTVPLGSVVVLGDALTAGAFAPGLGAGVAVARNAPVIDLVLSHRQVTTTIAVTDRGSMKPGDEVQVVFPDNSTKTGHVASIGSVASKDARNANATPTVPVVITLPEADIDPNLVSTPVTVNIAKDQAKGVLVVPTSALVALKEGGFAVQVADPSGSHLVGVKTGLYADTRVEITGDGITEGTKVMVPA